MPALTVPECFPPDDRLALFVVAAAMAANDVEDSMWQAAAANPDGASDEDRQRARFTFKVRVANGFLFEGIATLRAWQDHEPEVRQLLDGLSAEGRKKLRQVRGLEQQIGSKTLEHVRQHTFHYPRPDPSKAPDSTGELAEVVAELTDLPAGINVARNSQHTFRFADGVALALALRRHDDPETQIERIRDGGVAFVHLAKHIYLAYCEKRGIEFEVVD
ncbi:MAG TPA: hypothetical protein VFI03_12275 [Solirubrobacterales bacterium]|nr:hypothetical protein [Solirubrobacterales bacterium]